MGRSAKGDTSVLDVVLQEWPILIYVPLVLVLLGVLVGVTRWWDERDGMRTTEKKVRDAWRPRWRRQAVCTCSWHTIGSEVGAESS
jgi:hypothetical protein